MSDDPGQAWLRAILRKIIDRYPVLGSALLGGAAVATPYPIASLVVLLGLILGVQHKHLDLAQPPADDKVQPLLGTIIVAETEVKEREAEAVALRRRVAFLETELSARLSQIATLSAPRKRTPSDDGQGEPTVFAGSEGPSVAAATNVPVACNNPPRSPRRSLGSSGKLGAPSVSFSDDVNMARSPNAGSRVGSLMRSPAGSHSGSMGSRSPGTLARGTLQGRSNTRIVAEEVAAAADAAAAAEDTAAMLHVEIDNECDANCTVVRVVAPDRAQLLTDLTKALSGLGLSIERASISTVGTQAINSFYLLEKHDDGMRKILGKRRLAAIEQRLRLQVRARSLPRPRACDATALFSSAERFCSEPLRYASALCPPLPSPPSSLRSMSSFTLVRTTRSASPLAPPQFRRRAMQRLLKTTTLAGPMSTDVVSSASPGAAASGSAASTTSINGRTLPWPHHPLGPTSSDAGSASEAKLIDGLSAALAEGWGGSYGALAPTLARKLAQQVFPSMRRVAVPEGSSWNYVGDGEWLMLLESPAVCSVVSSSRGGRTRSGSGSSDRSDDLEGGPSLAEAMMAERPSNEIDEADLDLTEMALSAGSVLWEFAHEKDAASGQGGSSAAAAAATAPPHLGRRSPVSRLCRWHTMHNVPGGASAIVRCVHRSSLRAVLITLREALARSHAAQLAEIPLFSPLDPPELLSLCRRATEVQFDPNAAIQPNKGDGGAGLALGEGADGGNGGNGGSGYGLEGDGGSASVDQSAGRQTRVLDPLSIPHDAFALILSGDVLLSVPSISAHGGESATSSDDDLTIAMGAIGPSQLPMDSGSSDGEKSVDAAARAALPARIPLARLGAGRTLGETGELLSPSNVSASSGSSGAVLLVWRREASVTTELARLPLLLPSCWQAKAPLAAIAHLPRLISVLRPLALPQLLDLPPERLTASASLTAVLSGELTEAGKVEVKLSPITADSGSASPTPFSQTPPHASPKLPPYASPTLPSSYSYSGGDLYELQVVIDGRDRLLADLTATLSDLSLDVLDGDIATDSEGRAVDTLRVRDIAGSVHGRASWEGGPSDERAKTLEKRVQGRLQEVLSTTRLHPGEIATAPLTLTSATPSTPPLLAWIDMRALGVLMALDRTPLGAGWRAFLRCHHPKLVPALSTAAAPSGGGTGGTGRGPPASSGIPLLAPNPYESRPVDARLAEKSMQAEVQALRTALKAFGSGGHGDGNGGNGSGAALGGLAKEWTSAVTNFCLHRLREGAGRGDEGLSLQQLVRGPELGAGACGVVHLARDQLSGRVYAIKSFHLPNDEARQKTILRYLEREREILRLLAEADRQMGSTQRWFVHLVCAGQEGDALQLAMPACLGGELWNVLNEFGAMSEDEARFYAGCLTLALQRLHSLGIVYRDLKPENVLLRHDGWPIIADFGLSSFMLGTKPLYSLCGTPEFMAPEVIGATGSAGYGAGADWWSLGVLLCQCLTLSTPFVDPQQRPRKTFDNVLRGRKTVPPELEHHRIVSTHAASLIDSLLEPDVGRRLGGRNRGQVRTHPFFWGLDWERLERREIEPPHADFTAERARETSSNAFIPK